MPSIIEKAKELRATGLSAMEALKQARQEIIPPKIPWTTSPAPVISWWAIVEPVKPTVELWGSYTSTPNATGWYTDTYGWQSYNVTAEWQRTVLPYIPKTTTNSSPSVWGGSTPASKKTTAKSDTLDTTLKTDITNTYSDTKSSNTQIKTDQIKAEEDAAAETIANKEIERLQLEVNAREEDERQKKRAEEDARIQREYDIEYRRKQEANLVAVKAKQEQEERKLAIDNDVAQQSSAIAFAKLGLSLSTAGITTAQQIFTTWAYNLAKLKTENAYQYADLQEQVAKTEFEHTNAVNKIIRESEDKTYTIRKALNEEVYKIKNSIVKTTLEKKRAISKIQEDYMKARNENEKDFLKKMQDRADLVKKENDAIYDVLNKKEEYANNHIATLVSSGRWDILPDSEKVKLEKLAGVPFGTTDMQTKASLGKLLYKQAEEITGLKWITFAVGDYQKIVQDATFFKSQWLGPEDAMNRALDSYIRKSPEMQAKMRELAKKWTSGGGELKWKTDFGDWTLVNYTITVDWKQVERTWEYHKGKGETLGYISWPNGTRIDPANTLKVSVAETDPFKR